MTDPSRPRLLAYVRTSTRKQDLDSQRRAIAAWAAREGHEVTFFEDDHVSGRRSDRAGVENLLAAVERGERVIVAVTELSRFGRSISFVHKTVERVAAKGGRIVLVGSSGATTIDPNTLEGKALIGALALASEIEWHLCQERNARGRATIKERGVKVGRKRRDVSEAALRALLEKGLSIRAIARELKVPPSVIGRRVKALRAAGRDSVPKPPGNEATEGRP